MLLQVFFSCVSWEFIIVQSPFVYKMKTWFWIFGWFLSILNITGNGFIIFLVCRRRLLQTKTNAFVASLAVADVCVGLSTVPPLFDWEKTTGCDPEVPFANRVDYLRWLFMYASMEKLCSSVLDRYSAVVQPLNYLLFITRKRVPQIIFLSWALSILVVCPDVVTWLAFNDNRSRSLLLWKW